MNVSGALKRLAAAASSFWPGPRPQILPDQSGSIFRKSFDGPYLLDTPGDRTFEFCVEGYGPFIADMIAAYDRKFLFLDIGANLAGC